MYVYIQEKIEQQKSLKQTWAIAIPSILFNQILHSAKYCCRRYCRHIKLSAEGGNMYIGSCNFATYLRKLQFHIKCSVIISVKFDYVPSH